MAIPEESGDGLRFPHCSIGDHLPAVGFRVEALPILHAGLGFLHSNDSSLRQERACAFVFAPGEQTVSTQEVC